MSPFTVATVAIAVIIVAIYVIGIFTGIWPDPKRAVEVIRDWRDYRSERNAFWDSVPYAYRMQPSTFDTALTDFPLMRECERCHAHIGEKCVTASGRETTYHKARQSKRAVEVT